MLVFSRPSEQDNLREIGTALRLPANGEASSDSLYRFGSRDTSNQRCDDRRLELRRLCDTLSLFGGSTSFLFVELEKQCMMQVCCKKYQLFGLMFYMRCTGIECYTARLSRGLIESPLAIGTMATIYPQDHPTSPGE